MKRKLYSNMRRMTALFSVGILCLTVTALALRLTVFGDMDGLHSPSVQQVQSELFPFEIARRVSFRTPASSGDFRIENPADNQYYMSVSIILPETGQQVFYTGLIGPGETRQSATLHVQLPSGTYQCIARVTAYHPDTFEQRGSEDLEITLYIG